MDTGSKRRLVIVGGGSAGWMTAVFLSKVFGTEAGSRYSITLVESQEVPPIGVGEATVHTLRQFLGAAAVQEGEFLLAADATLKHGILFRDWVEGPLATERDQYFHSFENYPPIAPELMVNHWLNAKLRGNCTDRYDKWSGIQSALAANGVSPKDWQAKAYDGVVPYGYHLDANKFAHYLKSVALKRGVTHMLGHVATVSFDQSGNIESLTLRDGQRIEGDFFIDCSGFASILMSKLGGQFQSLSDQLFVDCAVTMRIPRTEGSYVPRTYTTATARPAGWTFEIDLSQRTGFGYIYSAAHIDAEKAEQELRSFVGPEHAGGQVNHIKTRVGRLKDTWIKNCVAIGLSAGFLEPLESTGLYFVELALRLFVDYFDVDHSDRNLQAKYNETIALIFDDVAQFIMLHYVLTQRSDTEFWRDVRAKAPPAKLEEKLRLWTRKAPTDSDFIGPTTPFAAPNYAAILFGMKRLTADVPGPVRHISPEQSLTHYNALKTIQQNAVASLPKHDQYLQKYTAAFT